MKAQVIKEFFIFITKWIFIIFLLSIPIIIYQTTKLAIKKIQNSRIARHFRKIKKKGESDCVSMAS